MRILWTRIAAEHLRAAIDFVADDNPDAAENQLKIIQRAIEQLADFPDMGRPGRVQGTRELIVSGTPYIVAYRSDRSTVRVLALLHGARRWPTRFEKAIPINPAGTSA